ncbi:ExeM/NucH family extracellular endonuclease [Aquipuribacter hungaricus]|uniref:ExeM/NucH family extracellular endonuclease n=1 Tax=Aquipuribacter hungaricus TaxID=545624 RepID=A0ABV7WNM9_9MICO
MTGTSTVRARALIGCTATLGLAVAGLTVAPAVAAPSTTPFISEIHYDNAGTDTGEAVEVQAAAGTDLTGWTLVRYNGTAPAAAVVYRSPAPAQPLGGVVPAGDASGDGVRVETYPADGLQNGTADGVALVDPAGTVVDFVSWEGVTTAADGPAAGRTSVDTGVAQTNSSPAGSSLQKVGGVWTVATTASFGTVNGSTGPGTDPEPEPDLCALTATTAVGAVQGSGAATPLAGQTVTVRGVVTSDTPGLSGFTVQDGGDSDPATSDGIFVALAGAQVSVGDVVTVRGPANEEFTLTQVGNLRADRGGPATVDVCSSGATVPAPTVLPLPSTPEQREPLESMLVDVTAPLVVTGTFGLESFGEVRLSTGGVLPTPTDVAEPGPAAAAVEADNRTREITVDDGSSRSGVRPVPYLTPTDSVRIGDPVVELGSHVLSYSFNQWRLQPVTGAPDQLVLGEGNPRTPTAEDVGGDVQVGAYNVLNYFVTLVSEDSDARGAETAEALALQEAKIVAGIVGLGADVVALQEIEYGVPFGKDADVALARLTAAVDAADTTGTWDYVRTPDYVRESPDVIQNAIVYRSDVVTPVGESLTGGTVDPQVWSNAREPVAQTFAAPDGDLFTVVGNHLKSKGGTGTGDNADAGVGGQGSFNGDRVRQAQALATFAGQLEQVDPDVLLIGDFNAYSREDPVDVLVAAGYVDVLEPLTDTTYSFDQRNGNLDHVLLSAAAAQKLTGADIWEVNAAEPFAYQYSSGVEELQSPDAYRASDHNPSVVGLDTVAPLGTDVSLADVLGEVAGPFDRDDSDFDVLAALVAAVLAEDPASPVAVLADPTVALTAFLPTDAAFMATGGEIFRGRVPQERVAYNRYLDRLGVDGVEQVLLGHVVPGQTLEAADVLALDGQQLTTAAGTTLTVDVRADGTVAVVDQRAGGRDALLVPGGTDINVGQVQVGHAVDRVLLP